MSNVIEILKTVGAIITNSHIVYTSGHHGSIYINKDALYPHTKETSEVGRQFAEKYKDAHIDVVVGPAYGGIILSQWTAYHLSQLSGKEVLGVYTQKTDSGGQAFSRGYDALVKGKNVLIVEDITNTGESAKKVVSAVQNVGATIVAVAVMVNRNPTQVNSVFYGAPFMALADFPAESFSAEACPLCKQNIPINTTVGHGKKFIEHIR